MLAAATKRHFPFDFCRIVGKHHENNVAHKFTEKKRHDKARNGSFLVLADSFIFSRISQESFINLDIVKPTNSIVLNL